MTRRLNAALVSVAAAAGSLFLSIPATVIMASGLRSAHMDDTPTSSGGVDFQVVYVDVSLVPALLVAVLTFVIAFMWMLRRRATVKHRTTDP